MGGVQFVVPTDPVKSRKFWDDESASLLMDAIDLLPDRYDAVVVDEAQDFCSDWWYPIEQVLENKNEESDNALYVFYDPAQNIYNRDFKPPKASGPFSLIENCRNTQKIAAFCRSIAGHDSVSSSNAPIGEAPLIKMAASSEDQRRDIQNTLKELMGQGGVEPSQVVILVSDAIKNSSFAGIERIGKFSLSDDFQIWRANESILIQTAKRFKGLEADVIILADVPDPETEWHFKTKDLYVAASRAKHRLFIFCKDQVAEHSIKKWL
jgi:DNA helicase IV